MDTAVLALLGGALLVGLVSATTALLPVEVYVLGAAATQPTGVALAVAVAAGMGQTVGKVALLLSARGAASPGGLGRFVHQRSSRTGAHLGGGVLVVPRAGPRAALARAACDLTAAATRWLRSRWAPLVVLVSAVAGVPPLMLLSVAAGVARVPVRRFAPACFVGRTARFVVVVLVTGAVAT
ncbi:hypothetical protein [Quadrisphaera sp. INWT6]|uniref:hypothetical protein n=1 Tax=Quadrisphaera sp. INWT6 TaxID=2596917 RepID=UPI001892128D|nr:hypothetical protein [Quadrisphaera sp. INWT6]MBF5082520.1 hypothetical protein [Quadrisphaera sp. INWT6]